jgi:multicomponent Na+:H+ antiporter subunit E
MNQQTPGVVTKRFLLPGVLFVGIWILLVGTDPLAWIVGAPAVVAATIMHARLRAAPATTDVIADRSALSPSALIGFIPFFLWESLRGGLDVAARVLVPRMRVHPGLHLYSTRLHGSAARVVFVNCISLLPGTLSADLRGSQLTIHALDVTLPLDADLHRLEERVARLFGEPLVPRPSGGSPAAVATPGESA